ncbi:MAG: peptide ABC transporter substrate-binding protein [Gemmatimonadota bacterium]|nr:peptide ABC transporter substrate-binding protein [Gemmatimonadota bacterium]
MRLSRRVPAFAFLLAAACHSDGGAGRAHSSTLVMTQPADANNMIPLFSTNEISVAVGSMLFEKLAEIGDSMNVIGDRGARPSLADSWTWAPDSLSIAFHIAPKAHWADGVPVRAADVLYSFRVNSSKVIGSPVRPLLAGIDSVTARDSLTPVIWFHARSLEQFFNAATQVRVLPAHLLASIPDSALQTAPFARHPVGSGPYKFVRWVSGSTIELAADSTFHRGAPKIDRLIWSIAGNPDAAMLRLYSGEANFISTIRKQDSAQIASHPELKLMRYPSMVVAFVRFNLHARKGGGPHAVFGDREVRRALSMAIDRRRAVSTVIDSATPLLLGPLTSNLPTYDRRLPSLPYAPDSAASILERRGWVLGKDGLRHKGAIALQFSMLVPTTSTERQQMAVVLQDMWKKVGAKMDIERVDFPTMGSRTAARDFDMTFERMALDPTPSGIRQEWSETAARAGGPSNSGSYTNTAFDAIVDSAVETMDRTQAITLYRRAYGVIIEDAPAVWLYESASIAAMATNVHPVAMRRDMWFVNLADWTIDGGSAPKGASVALAAGAH